MIFLPLWNKIREKIKELNQPNLVLSILPLWLMVHTSNSGELLPLDTNPDFETIE